MDMIVVILIIGLAIQLIYWDHKSEVNFKEGLIHYQNERK